MKISQIFKGIGKSHKIFQPVNIQRKVNYSTLSISNDYYLLKKYYDANRKTNRDIIELIYEKESKEQKLILTKTQTKELNSALLQKEEKKVPSPIVNPITPILFPIVRKLPKKEINNEPILQIIQKEYKNKLRKSISTNILINQLIKQRYKSIQKKISRSSSSSRYYECFSHPIYVNILN